MSRWKTSTLPSPTGSQLRVYEQPATTIPRAIIHINHGLAEHAARYERFAAFLASHGYASIAHDHRGHGYTTAPGAPLASFGPGGGWKEVIADVGAVAAHARQLWPSTPLVSFGHSMGAVIVMNQLLAETPKPDAIAVWNSNFENNLLTVVGSLMLKTERMLKGSDVPSSLAGKLTFDAWNAKFKPNRTAFDWLSRDAAEVDKYVADPLCGFPATIGMWLAVISGVQATHDRARLASLPKQLPAHFLAGTGDPCSEYGKSIAGLAERLERAGLVDVTLELVDGARHETLNETVRDSVMAGFVHWLDERFAA
ncbi:MAG: alpha/beta hydrolase [Rhizobiaceae bacterium]